MVAPDLINVEVLSVLRRLLRAGKIDGRRADQSLVDLFTAPLRRLPTLPLLASAWRWRDNLSAYDACYVALSEALACPLITGDARLARAPLPIHVIIP